MIIELYGSPGSGKSYMLSKVVGKPTNSKGISKKPLVMFIKKLSAYLPYSLKLKRRMRNLLGTEKYHYEYFDRPMIDYLNNICMLIIFYRILRHRNTYIDEGYIQRITAMAVNYNIPLKKTMLLIKIVHDQVPFVKPIYLKTDIDSCLLAIHTRNRHEVEMDELSDDRLQEFLKKYDIYFNCISRQYDHFVLLRGEDEKLKEILYD